MNYLASMVDSAKRLQRARERAGYLTAKDAAEAMGVPIATYIQHENGTRGYPASRAQRYGIFFRVAPEWLLYGSKTEVKRVALGPELLIRGEVADGVWRSPVEYDPDECAVFAGRTDVLAPMKLRFGLRVTGESMNKVFPTGTILECVEIVPGDEMPNEKYFVVERAREGKHETTVKQLRMADDGTFMKIATTWKLQDAVCLGK